jgi:hypothetical protein
VHATLALGHACGLTGVEADAPELPGVAARFVVRVACAFAPLAARTDVPARAETLLRALRAQPPAPWGGAAMLCAALAQTRAAASRASTAQALRILRDTLAVATTPELRSLVDEELLEDCCAAVEDGAASADVVEQGLASINNALHQVAAARAGFALTLPGLLRRLVAVAARALGSARGGGNVGAAAGAGVELAFAPEQAARVLQQLAASEPFAFADVAAALVADHDLLSRAASALREARAFGGLRGPASAAQGAAVHVLRLLSALALSPAICLAPDGGSPLPDLLAALRGLFVEDAGGGGGGAAPPAAAVYAAAGELVARLLALDEGGAAGAALRSSALEVGDALEAWWAEPGAAE